MAVAVARTVARAATAGIAAGVVMVAGQVVHVGRLDLPEHPDLDATGPVGSAGPPMLEVVVGDSACTGPGLDRADDIWIRQLLARFDHRTFAFESFAVGGAQTSDVIADQPAAATSRRRDIAVVSVAANDALHGRSPIGVEARLSLIVDELLDHAGAVVLMGVGDVGSAPRIPFPLSTMATAVCRTVDLAQRRVAATRPGVFKAPMWEVTTASFRSRRDVWSTDRYHPNAAGHALWADAVHPPSPTLWRTSRRPRRYRPSRPRGLTSRVQWSPAVHERAERTTLGFFARRADRADRTTTRARPGRRRSW